MSDPTITCASTPCTVIVQLDASTAIQQVSDAFPTFSDLLPVFAACVTLLLVGWSIRMARHTLT